MRRHERATDRLGCECRSARHESTAVNAAAVPLPSSSVAIPADGVLLPGDLTLPEFHAVGQFYVDFSQVDDAEVKALLQDSDRPPAPGAAG